MKNLSHQLFLKKYLLVISIIAVAYTSLSFAQGTSASIRSVENSVLSRYMQIIINSYSYYQDKFGLAEPKEISEISNFPILMNSNNKRFTEQKFHTEMFFSRLNLLTSSYKTSRTKIKNKIIRISNIPVNNGYLSSRFGIRKDPMHGSRRLHKGIDIAAKYGSPVNPLGEGLVMYSGYKPGYGNTVEIKHGNSILTRYAHLKQYLVDEGQAVKVGDVIGLIGSTGRSTGPHLHLEVLLNGNQVDPQIFLANHFGSRSNAVQIATKPIDKNKAKGGDLIKPRVVPVVKRLTQISYQDYVKSVEGMYGFSAPVSISD